MTTETSTNPIGVTVGNSSANELQEQQSSQKKGWLTCEFWIGDEKATRLRVFEILFTLTFCFWMTYCFTHWEEWLTPKGFHLNNLESAAQRYPAPFPLLNSTGVLALGALIFASSLSLICNWWRRGALLVLFLCALYVQGADYLSSFTLNKLYIAVYAILLLSPGYCKSAAGHELQICLVPIRVIQATLILQYLAAGISKAFVGDWLKYDDVLLTHVQGLYRTNFAAWCVIFLPEWSWTLMQWTALLFELEAPLLFCLKKLRPIAFIIGIGFHLIIALMMKDLIFFSAQMWTFYALFVTPEQWRRLGGKLKALCLVLRAPKIISAQQSH